MCTFETSNIPFKFCTRVQLLVTLKQTSKEEVRVRAKHLFYSNQSNRRHSSIFDDVVSNLLIDQTKCFRGVIETSDSIREAASQVEVKGDKI